jgi:hypothetical protein
MERYLGAKIKELRQIWLNGLTNLYRLSVAMKAMPTPFPPMY